MSVAIANRWIATISRSREYLVFSISNTLLTPPLCRGGKLSNQDFMMLKPTSVALGLLAVVAIAPKSQAATLQDRVLSKPNPDLHAQVVVQIGVPPIVIGTPVVVGRPVVDGAPSRYEIERQREIERRERYGRYERHERYERYGR
jgi:hypothetical protein